MSIWAVSMWGHRVVLLWTFLLMSFGHKSAHFSLDACLVVVQSLSHVWLFETPWNAACQASLSFTIPQSLFKLMSFDLVMPTNHLILCHPLLHLPFIFPSIRIFPVSWLFASGGQRIGASASASVLPMNIQGWFPLGLAVWSLHSPRGLDFPCSPRGLSFRNELKSFI